MEVTEVRKLVELEEKHWWYRERRALLRRMVTASSAAPPAGSVALDIGAAGGGNTAALRALGIFAVPVEFGAAGAEVARDRGLPSIRGDARQLPFADCSTDLVVAFDVLEHIEEDRSALAEIYRVLRPSGRLLVAVPADMRLWSEHDRAVGHVRRYSRGELTSSLAAAGLTLERLWSWNVLLRPLVALRRRSSTGSDLQDLGVFLNTTLRGVIATERYMPWLRRGKGVSLLAEARRPA